MVSLDQFQEGAFVPPPEFFDKRPLAVHYVTSMSVTNQE